MNNSIGMEIKSLNNMIVHCIERTITKNRRTPTIMHGRIIGFLYDNRERDIFQKDIEARFSIRGSTVTSILKLMEHKGLIQRREVPDDARLKKLVLTQQAIDLHMEFIHDMEKVEQQLRKNLTEEEIVQFFAISAKIKNNTV